MYQVTIDVETKEEAITLRNKLFFAHKNIMSEKDCNNLGFHEVKEEE